VKNQQNQHNMAQNSCSLLLATIVLQTLTRAAFWYDLRPMTGLTKNTPRPTDIKLHQVSRRLEISFDNAAHFSLPCEFLRVFSPSAEVRGHGPGQDVLQLGKEDVNIVGITPVGQYAVKLTFSDGHDTGLYSWDYLYELGSQQVEMWQKYLDRLAAAGHTRKVNT
jgi:DUF971 family protein